MHNFVDILKKYWDVFGGTFIGLIYSFIVKWELNKIQLAYSIIILILVIIGFFRFFIKKKENKKDIIDKSLSTQNFTKAIHIAENPSQEGEELGQLVIETINGGKKIMNFIKKIFYWIKSYRQQLVGLLGALIYCFFAIFLAIKQYLEPITSLLPQSLGWTISVYVVYGILTILTGYYLFRNQIKWVGLGSIKKATDYINNKGQEIAGTLNNANRKKFKDMLNTAKKSLKVAQTNLSTLTTNYNSVVKQLETQNQFLETLFSVGAEQTTIAEAQTRKNEITSSLNTIANELNKAKQEVSNLEKNINDYEKALAM